ncbi:GNAT family N-acetyltransferase [Evansella sp. AB-rgal1]|uniref:GNAT family N-acetyltransferase n=1 Tax=Evansella sp. AB-rgal1 TaxID=3242696 RepID=UPI00359D0CEC
MCEIKQLILKQEKTRITDSILRQLPEWFGIEEALVNYVEGVVHTDVYALYVAEKPVGLISIKSNNQYTSEIYVMGILKEHQNSGFGKKLLEVAQDRLRMNKVNFLMVKTLSDSHPDIHYKKTREFYHKTGFYPLEEIKEIWGKENPCLVMVKSL